MKPISFINYFKNNKKRVAVFLLSVSLVIMMNIVINAFAVNMDDSSKSVCIPLKYASEVSFKRSDINYNLVLNKLKAMNDVERIITCVRTSSGVSNLVGGSGEVSVYRVTGVDFEYMCKLYGIRDIRFIPGQPKNDGTEIVLNERVLRNKRLKTGDEIGREIQQNEWLEGRYRIEGSFKGDVTVGIIADDGLVSYLEHGRPTFIVVPKLGRMEEVNAFLDSLDKSEVAVSTYEKAQIENQQDTKSFDSVFNIFLIMTICVLSVCLGNSSYVHYFNRRREFGLLKAIGFSDIKIVKLVMKETLISVVIGFVAGVAISLLIFTVLNNTIIYQKGLIEMSIDSGIVYKLASIPLFVGMAAVIPVLAMLKNIDSITIIERKR